MMEDTLISYETSVLAKEVGFDEFCENIYTDYLQNTDYKQKGIYLNKNSILKGRNSSLEKNEYYELISAPTQSLLSKWIREKYLLHIEIYGFVSRDEQTRQYYHCIRNMKKFCDLTDDSETFDTYEECLEDALQQCLNIIKNNI